MNPNYWPSLLGLIGTILLAVVPIRVEWFRFRSRRLDGATPSNPLLAELVNQSKVTREAIIVAKWTIRDSMCVIFGVFFLMASYVIQLLS